jgi:hypothetical protein
MRYEKGFVLFYAVYSGKEDRTGMIEEAKQYCTREGHQQGAIAIADTGDQIIVRAK